MRLLVSEYPGLVVYDRSRSAAPLKHLFSVNPVFREYEQWDHGPDGPRCGKDGEYKKTSFQAPKGALMLDFTKCAVPVPEW